MCRRKACVPEYRGRSSHFLLLSHNVGSCDWTLKRNMEISKLVNKGGKIRTKMLFPLAKVGHDVVLAICLRTGMELRLSLCSTH